MSQVQLFYWVGCISALMFCGSIIAIPWMVSRLPVDYFIKNQQDLRKCQKHRSLLTQLVLLGRNILGLFFIMIGIAMLFLPGQGILTIIIGIAIMNFHGKNTLLQWLVRTDKVRKTLNWMRSQSNKAPLKFQPRHH